jgi:hypothetical protein
MTSKVVIILCSQVTDWDSFHQTFTDALGFPTFYGRNMDAWIDCLTCLDEDDGMSIVKIPKGGQVILQLNAAEAFKLRCPEIFEALVDCANFVNVRRVDEGDMPVLALMFA